MALFCYNIIIMNELRGLGQESDKPKKPNANLFESLLGPKVADAYKKLHGDSDPEAEGGGDALDVGISLDPQLSSTEAENNLEAYRPWTKEQIIEWAGSEGTWKDPEAWFNDHFTLKDGDVHLIQDLKFLHEKSFNDFPIIKIAEAIITFWNLENAYGIVLPRVATRAIIFKKLEYAKGLVLPREASGSWFRVQLNFPKLISVDGMHAPSDMSGFEVLLNREAPEEVKDFFLSRGAVVNISPIKSF